MDSSRRRTGIFESPPRLWHDAAMNRSRTNRRTLALVLGVLLLALPGAVRAQSPFGVSPIFDAAANGDTAGVEYLLQTGTPVDLTNAADETILTIAAANGHRDIVELAIARGARIDHEDRFGKTALCWAAERGRQWAAERLLARGADIAHPTRDGMTPLMLAVRSGGAGMVRLLLGHRPDLSLQDYTGRDALAWARDARDPRIDAMLRRAGAAR